MRNAPVSDNTLISQAANELASRLPDSWRTKIDFEPTQRNWGIDARLEICAPDGTKRTLILEAKRRIGPSGVAVVANQLTLYSQLREETEIPILVAPFLSTRTQERLTESGIGYIDLTGNIRVAVDRPALFIQTKGAERNPWREERPARTLKGAKAGRIVRALCDFSPPVGVRELASKSKTDPGYVSRVFRLLEKEDLIQRESRGPVTNVDWQDLIRRWTEDYSLFGSNRTVSYLEPRGLPALLEKLRNTDFRYAITGSLGSARVAPVAPARLAVCYVDDLESAGERLGLRPAEAGANVVLAEPSDSVVYERTWEQEGLTFAALSQIAADLLTSPGRGPAEADELMEWMAKNENVWRL